MSSAGYNSKEIAVIVEGDISEAELSDCDDECPEEKITTPDDDEYHSILQKTRRSGFQAEVRDLESEDIEDDLPLAVLRDNLRKLRKPSCSTVESKNVKVNKNNLRWLKRPIEAVDTTCSAKFSPPPTESISALEYFHKFVDEDIITNFVVQTNLYSVQKDGANVNTSTNEMKRFLGMNIMMGIQKYPNLISYWSQFTRLPNIANVMARNRFQKLRSCFHVNDNSSFVPKGQDGYDKLFKVRPFIDALRENFGKVEPEEYNSVDEIMIPFKGRSSMKQYMKNKPHKWGIKVFARSGSSGFIYDYEIYTGKDTNRGQRTELGLSGDIVLHLVGKLPQHENYKVFTDNWFTSHSLMVALKSRGILSVGTVKTNRLPGCSFASDASLKSLRRGSYDFRCERSTNIFALKWFDRKAVHVASSYIGHEPVAEVRRWSQETSSFLNVPCPGIITEYNKFMGGVDLHNMLVELYRIETRTKRYYLRIIFHLIDMSIVNAWLLYRRHKQQLSEKHVSLLDFKAEVAYILMNTWDDQPKKRGRPSESEEQAPTTKRMIVVPRPPDCIRYDHKGHLPQFLSTQQRCKLCIKGRSLIKCQRCDIALCIVKSRNCFTKFHTK